MSKLNYLRPFVGACLATSLLLLGACQPSTPQPVQPTRPAASLRPTDPNAIAVNLTQGRQVISGQLLDARTGQLVTVPTQIRITGADAGKVQQTSLTSDRGLVGLVLKTGVKPSAEQPLHLTLVAEAEGYFVGSAQIHLSDLRESFHINLTHRLQPPPGVGTVSDATGQAGTNGQLSAGINLQAQVDGSHAQFGLKPGTVLTDANGRPLQGALQTHVGYFSNGTAESLNAFPGGFAPNGVNLNGQNQQGYFVTGGFVSVDITDSAGNKAAQFSQPAEVTIQIPTGTVNPDTQQAIKAGDTIGIWSHNTETGQWSLEGQGNVSLGSNGHFDVTYPVSHLSYWNLDWFYGERCDPELRLFWSNENKVPVLMEVLMNDANWYTHSNLLQDPVNHLFNVPVGRDLTFVAKYRGKILGQTRVNLNQSCLPVVVNINSQELPALRTVPVTVTLGSQTEFKRDDIENLALRFGLNSDLTGKILAYTHPGDPQQIFAFDAAAYQEFIRLGVKTDQVQLLQALLSQTYSPSTYLSYYLAHDPNTYDSVYVENGQAELTLVEGEVYSFFGYVYYNDQYFFIEEQRSLQAGEQNIRLDLKNIDLTLEVAKSFLQQVGTPFSL